MTTCKSCGVTAFPLGVSLADAIIWSVVACEGCGTILCAGCHFEKWEDWQDDMRATTGDMTWWCSPECPLRKWLAENRPRLMKV